MKLTQKKKSNLKPVIPAKFSSNIPGYKNTLQIQVKFKIQKKGLRPIIQLDQNNPNTLCKDHAFHLANGCRDCGYFVDHGFSCRQLSGFIHIRL
jgi:hypothetical protein